MQWKSVDGCGGQRGCRKGAYAVTHGSIQADGTKPFRCPRECIGHASPDFTNTTPRSSSPPTHTCSLDLLDAILVADAVEAGEQLIEEPDTQDVWKSVKHCASQAGRQDE